MSRTIGERLATLETEVDGVKETITELKSDIRGLRSALIWFAFSVAGSAIGIAATFVLTRHG